MLDVFPLNFTDPTGHRECGLKDIDCDNPLPNQRPPTSAEQVQQGVDTNIYGIIFKADDGEEWTDAQMQEILSGARDIERRMITTGMFAGYVPGQIWREIYGTVTMLRSSRTQYLDNESVLQDIYYGAETIGSTIEVYDVAVDGVSLFSFRLNMVHEFGHRLTRLLKMQLI